MELSLIENPAVVWILFGIAGLLLELVLPGLIILFFGFGALLTGFVYWIIPLGIEFQLIIFLVSSSVLLILFRKWLQKSFFEKRAENKDELEEEFVGKQAEAVTDFVAGSGKVSFKGTTWNAVSTQTIKQGEKVIIEKRDSLTLIVTL
ncbi:MAG TPA: NfeD family protein [Bacteroidales bacterium]|nr:NfeD family protein [Bacteroidales bacterium]